MRNIKKFYINKAQYYIEDSLMNSLVVEIDYKNNTFDFVGNSKTALMKMDLVKDAKFIANDLLKRKHNVNFVDKLIK